MGLSKTDFCLGILCLSILSLGQGRLQTVLCLGGGRLQCLLELLLVFIIIRRLVTCEVKAFQSSK